MNTPTDAAEAIAKAKQALADFADADLSLRIVQRNDPANADAINAARIAMDDAATGHWQAGKSARLAIRLALSDAGFNPDDVKTYL